MTRKIRVGVIGCGYWGPNFIRHLVTMPNCELSVICDLKADRLAYLQEVYPSVQTQSSFDRVLEDYDLDAVFLSTPTETHFDLAHKSLSRGLHTFIEKPMATSSEQCRLLTELAQKRGLILMVGFVFLYCPSILKIKEIIDSGEIGDVLYIHSRRLNLGMFQTSINVLWDLAPHDLSIIMFLLGKQPKMVNAYGQAHITKGIEDVAWLGLDFGNCFGSLQVSWLDPKKVREMTIVGNKKMIVYNDVQPIEKVRIYDIRVDTPPHYDTFAEFQFAYHHGDQNIPRINLEEPLRRECRHFFECIEQMQEPLTNGAMGTQIANVLECASDSLKKQGAPVMIPSVNYDIVRQPISQNV